MKVDLTALTVTVHSVSVWKIVFHIELFTAVVVAHDNLYAIFFLKSAYLFQVWRIQNKLPCDCTTKVDFFGLCTAHTFFSPGKLIKKSELVLAWVY